MGFAQENLMVNTQILGTSLVVQCLGLCTFNAWGTGSVPALGTNISHAWCGQKIKWLSDKDLLCSTVNYMKYLLKKPKAFIPLISIASCRVGGLFFFFR